MSETFFEIKKYYEEKREKFNQFYFSTSSVLVGFQALANSIPIHSGMLTTDSKKLIACIPFIGIVVGLTWILALYRFRIILKTINNFILEQKESEPTVKVHLQLAARLKDFVMVREETILEMLVPIIFVIMYAALIIA